MYINNKILLILIESVQIILVCSLIALDSKLIFLLGFLPRILIKIFINLFSMSLKKHDGSDIEYIVHITTKYDECFIVKNFENKWYHITADFDFSKCSKYYGRESTINFKSGAVHQGYFIKVMMIEFIIVYILSIVAMKIFGLTNYVFIVFNISHAIYKLSLCGGLNFRPFNIKLNEENYSFVSAVNKESRLNRDYVTYGIGKTEHISLCATCNKEMIFAFREKLEDI